MSKRTFIVRGAMMACAATLLALAGCAVSPDMKPRYLRQLASPPATTFESVVLVFAPVPRPGDRTQQSVYDKTWGNVAEWRQPLFRRIERNFARNGLRVKVVDGGAASMTLESTDLRVHLSPEGITVGGTGLAYGIRGDASSRGTRHLTFSDDLQMQRSPEREADRLTWLILNSLRSGLLIKAPEDGSGYKLAP